MVIQANLDFLLLISFLPSLIVAKTDLTGCAQTTSGSKTMVWYDPCSGEICAVPLCEVNSSPVTNDPACPQYSGSSTYSPSFLSGYSTVPMSYTASCGNAVYTAVQTTTQTLMSAVTPASSAGNGGNGGNGANGANGSNGANGGNGVETVILTPGTVVLSPAQTATGGAGAGNGNASAGNGGASGPATATTTQSPSSSQSSGGASSDTGAAAAPSQFTGAAVVGKSRSMNGAFVGLLAGALLI